MQEIYLHTSFIIESREWFNPKVTKGKLLLFAMGVNLFDKLPVNFGQKQDDLASPHRQNYYPSIHMLRYFKNSLLMPYPV
jgi:hypothetical protein